MDSYHCVLPPHTCHAMRAFKYVHKYTTHKHTHTKLKLEKIKVDEQKYHKTDENWVYDRLLNVSKSQMYFIKTKRYQHMSNILDSCNISFL